MLRPCSTLLRSARNNLNFIFSKTYFTSNRAYANFRSMTEINRIQESYLQEPCILVDNDDNIIGSGSKKQCHLIDKGNNKCPLHRAFSVFLFNQSGELLIQQRSDAKITFPGFWANTCCSHPLSKPEELEVEGAIGVKRAAQRKLKHELGIEKVQVPLEDIHFITRVHYSAPYNETWGEHEIDYILFTQREVSLQPEPNEVQNYKYVTPEQMKEFLANADKTSTKISPWLQLIAKSHLFDWWKNLDNLKSLYNHRTILRL
ncbi:isopentenyl-diphosphate Delta-isomerase 1-like [Anneissia japonica]|uniref:isopentenyl-diphosphate Delta-isomerase 1-like n=1 Tax=Anneissia japonica TaxID=1529436 RepID=UPI001425AB82|nr:isopentenyl-diphosphate Delta-isomerase 1-like [Anneissia japonica]